MARVSDGMLSCVSGQTRSPVSAANCQKYSLGKGSTIRNRAACFPCKEWSRDLEGKFCERCQIGKTAKFARARMAELFSCRRADRPWASPGRLSCFERMEPGQCRVCLDFRRVGWGSDADS